MDEIDVISKHGEEKNEAVYIDYIDLAKSDNPKYDSLVELGKPFLINNNEFKVCFINEKEKRFSADPISDETFKKIKEEIEVGTKFTIENQTYIVTYFHKTKKRITAKKLVSGY